VVESIIFIVGSVCLVAFETDNDKVVFEEVCCSFAG